MTDPEVAGAAARLLKDAIRAGRLSRRPDPGMLSRAAAVIGPVLVAQKASIATSKKKTAGRAGHRQAAKRMEGTVHAASTY